MDINVTPFINEHLHNMSKFSDSVFNSGLDNIGEITWNNANDVAEELILVDDRNELESHFVEYGAWTAEELAAMSLIELNALLIQFVSSDYRETYEDLEEDKSPNEETMRSLYKSDDGNWFYYLGL